MNCGLAGLRKRVMATVTFVLSFVGVSMGLGPTLQAQAPSENAVISLSVASNDSARVVAGTINAPDAAGIYYSEDGGVTWAQASGLPANISVAALEHDAVNPAIVYAGDATVGLFLRSTDGGRSFQDFPAIGTWLSLDSGIGALYAQNVNGRSVLYAGTRQDGVLVSYDNGESWVLNAIGLAQTDDLQQSERRIRTLIAFADNLYIGTHNGAFVQVAGSDTWKRTPGFSEGAVVRSFAIYRGNLYAGLQAGGLWRMNDEGEWTPISRIPDIASVLALGQAGPEGILLSAATGVGIWSGNGEEWLKVQIDGGPNDPWIWSADGADGVIYLGTAEQWILRSDDQGYAYQVQSRLTPLTSLPLDPITLPDRTPSPAEPTQVPAVEPAVAEIVPTPEPAEQPEMAEPTVEPQPTAIPAATPTPAIVPEEPGIVSGLNLPLDFLQEDIDLPVIGPISPIVLSVAILLIVIILVGSISVFRRTTDDED